MLYFIYCISIYSLSNALLKQRFAITYLCSSFRLTSQEVHSSFTVKSEIGREDCIRSETKDQKKNERMRLLHTKREDVRDVTLEKVLFFIFIRFPQSTLSQIKQKHYSYFSQQINPTFFTNRSLFVCVFCTLFEAPLFK